MVTQHIKKFGIEINMKITIMIKICNLKIFQKNVIKIINT